MDMGKLQEFKRMVAHQDEIHGGYYEIPIETEFLEELITALEATQTSLDEMSKERDYYYIEFGSQRERLENLRNQEQGENAQLSKQLETNQQQLADAECDVLNLQNDASHFNADHRHAHEHIERLKIENHDLSTQLAASQAEVERLEALPHDKIVLIGDEKCVTGFVATEPDRTCCICGMEYVDGKHP